jgi:bifunctional non-homologous end joining protein LigD
MSRAAATAPLVRKSRPRKSAPAAPVGSAAAAPAADGLTPEALGSNAPAASVRIGRKELSFSNLNKVLYKEAGFTKRDVLRYYLGVAHAILPHLKGRTLTLKRYPDGSEGFFFYEKSCPSHRPPWLDTAHVTSRRKEGFIDYCVVNDAAALAWVANLASLELHTSLARARAITRPTMMVFDLDPGPPAGMIDCCRVALRMRDVLAGVGLQSFPKTSGGKGLHFYVPLNTPCTFDQTKSFAHTLALAFENDDPTRIVSSMKKDLRHNKVLIDWSQNDEHKTTVCAYSLRARVRPTVSTPVTWKEVEDALKAGDPDRLIFEAGDVVERVRRLGDLFEPLNTLKQRLPAG